MKPIKVFCFAVLTASIAMAFVGLSSAMAESTALCTKDENPCSEANEIKHFHWVSKTKATLLSENEIGCDVLVLGGPLLIGIGIPPYIVYDIAISFVNCTSSCSVKEENGPGEIKILKTASELAAVTGGSLVRVKCFFGLIDCSYNGEGLEGHAVGALFGGTGSVTIAEQELFIETGSKACDPEAFLDLETTPLVATYITK